MNESQSSCSRALIVQEMTSCYILVDEFVTYFTGKEDVWAQAQLVPDALVAHSRLEVPQAEDGAEGHEAVGVVSCLGCHVCLCRLRVKDGGEINGTLSSAREARGSVTGSVCEGLLLCRHTGMFKSGLNPTDCVRIKNKVRQKLHGFRTKHTKSHFELVILLNYNWG